MSTSPTGRGRILGLSVVSLAVAAALTLPTVACSDGASPLSPLAPQASMGVLADVPAPSGLVTTSLDGSNLELWPFTGSDLPHDGQDATPSDPINLVFLGQADPRSIRQALLQLDGDRSAFGPLAAFDCTWSDASGDVQTAYTTPAGWTGSVIQLQCGSYGPAPRFHLRLFPDGDLTLGGAHFEIQIPGTSDHQVLSWELAEQLVTADLARANAAGLITFGAPPSATGAINPAPYRTIPKDLYNAFLADPTLGPVLPALTGGPSAAATADVPLQTDGRATVLTLADAPAPAAGAATYDFTVDYEPLFPLPRPYCNPAGDRFILAQGPVHFTGRIEVTPDGRLVSHERARGTLTLYAYDPATGSPSGEPYKAEVQDQQDVVFGGGTPVVTALVQRQEVPPTGAVRGSFRSRLHIGPGGSSAFTLQEKCEP